MDTTISTLISSAERGDRSAAQALFAALYGELHQMARRKLAHQGGRVTLGATTLLHEAYLDISSRDGARFPDRGRFMAYASRVMRGLIIDYVRSRHAHKRGGEFHITSMEEEVASESPRDRELLDLSEALEEFATIEPWLAQVVDLKFFCGFSFAEIGAMHGLSERTVQRQWNKARIYLHQAMRDATTK